MYSFLPNRRPPCWKQHDETWRPSSAASPQELRAGHELARLGTARNELPHDADSAACARLQVGMVAERRNLYVRGLGCGKEVRSLRDLYGLAVDL